MKEEAGDLTVSRQSNQVIAKNNLFQISFDLSKGTWNYIDKTGYSIIRDAYTRIILQNGTVLTTLDPGISEFITSPTTEDDFGIYQPITFSHQPEGHGVRTHLYLKCYPRKPYIVLNVGVKNTHEQPIALEQISTIDVSPHNGKAKGGVYLGGAPSGYHAFVDMNTPMASGLTEIHDGFHINEDTATTSCYNGVLYDTESKRSLVFGFLSFQKWWPAVQMGYDGGTQRGKEENHGVNHWALYHKCENHICRQGEEVYAEPVYLNFAHQGREAYHDYAEMVGHRTKPKSLNRVFSGWSAQDSEEGPINAAQIAQQIEQITKNRLSDPSIPGGFEYVQIGKGWEESIGSYQADVQKFPNGMKSVADQIHAEGLKAGIRFTPFCVEINSELLRMHPEYFLQERNKRKPTSIVLPEDGREVAILDVSQPGAQAHIRQNTRTLINEWGYDLVKADLLAYLMGPLTELNNFVAHDPSLTAVELYRLGVQLLNEVIDESEREVVLAACNTCRGPSIGDFVLNETSSGYGGYVGEGPWESPQGLKPIANAHTAHLPMYGSAWTNEFGTLTINEPLPLNEALIAMTMAGLSGGVVTCGDDLTTLKPERAELLAKVFPLTGNSAIPVDLYESKFPQIWNLPVTSASESYNVVGVFNWTDRKADVDFTLESLGLNRSRYYLVHDFWNREFLGNVRERITLFDIPSRSVKLLCLRAEQKVPQLLATDIHLTQGGVDVLSAGWDKKSQSFLAVCKTPWRSKGTLFIHVPEGYVPASTACYTADYHFRWNRQVYEFEFNSPTELVQVCVQFAKTSG